MNYFPFHIGDYAVHTRHLTLMEDLAYRRLLDVYYTREAPLPADDAQVARLVGMREQQAEVAAVLVEFFTLIADGWINRRADGEIQKMQAKQENARESVARRQANAIVKQAPREHDASVKQALSTNTNTNTNTKEEEIAPSELAESPPKGADPPPPPPFDGNNAKALNGKCVVSLSPGWELPEDWGVDAEALGWQPKEVLYEAEKFRQYWTAGKGIGTRRAVKGWRQTWSNWLGKAAERKLR